MPSKRSSQAGDDQLSFDLNALLQGAKVVWREDLATRDSQEGSDLVYSPVSQTADYMRRAVQFEEAWETTIQRARTALLMQDARQLYLDFLVDMRKVIEDGTARAPRLAQLVEQVGMRGLGISRAHLSIERPLRGGNRWRFGHFDLPAIERHIAEHIVGLNFLNPIALDDTLQNDDALTIGGSDVSQHRSAVPVPARFFKRSVPFVLNNAAGAIFRLHDGRPKYENVFNPRPDETLLRWMLIDPSYQDELEPEDYERCLASAMDVGQYRFDLEYLMKADKYCPRIIFRDGSLFPQDAYLDNYVVENRRGEFTREAIREMLDCLSYARQLDIVYCGVAKNVQLKVYSALLDWFIARNIDPNWEVGDYTLNDGQAMSMLLASPAFVGENLQESVTTCLIRRSFTTRANLNTRADLNDLDSYFRSYEAQHDVDITPFKRLCALAHTYMFYVGHSKSPQQQLPRYEFFYPDTSIPAIGVAGRILSGLRRCGFTRDEDHSMMAERPIAYLIPAITHQAHLLSKDVGKHIDATTGQWIMARYQSMLPKAR